MSKYPYYIEVPFSTDANTKEVVEWTTFEVKDKEDEQFVNYCYKQIAKPKEKKIKKGLTRIDLFRILRCKINKT